MQVYAGYTCSKSIKLYALWGLIQVQAVSIEPAGLYDLRRLVQSQTVLYNLMWLVQRTAGLFKLRQV